ncbi:MAG: enoyl-CoA hydratase-related protein [Leptospiraceae bacterium]|nr:enoyl-CoA hydratase-related protein [Leptospiraceae bacterium]
MKYIKQELRDGILAITIQKPETLNALSGEVLSELEEVVDSISASDEHKVVILTGDGKAFVAGADIACMSKYDEASALEFSKLAHRIFEKIENANFISIALINGFALGGGLELALSCDIRYASTKAKLGFPEVSLGLIPGFGGTQRLARLVGVGIASEWVYSGEMFSAEQSKSFGVVNNIYEPDDLFKEGHRLAASIHSRGKQALINAKKTMRAGLNLTLPQGLRLEEEKFSSLFGKPESKEGMGAFLEKRKPNF